MSIKHLKVKDLNENLICEICKGYLIDVSTITNCCHSFCRSCLLKSLNLKVECPRCGDKKVKFRRDRILQTLVYKIVPKVYEDEISKRKHFSDANPSFSGLLLNEGEVTEASDLTNQHTNNIFPHQPSTSKPPSNQKHSFFNHIFSPSDHINLEVNGRISGNENPIIFHLNCPSMFTVALLQRFVKAKFGIFDTWEVLFHHEGELLHDHYNLIDLAYITNTTKVRFIYIHYIH